MWDNGANRSTPSVDCVKYQAAELSKRRDATPTAIVWV